MIKPFPSSSLSSFLPSLPELLHQSVERRGERASERRGIERSEDGTAAAGGTSRRSPFR